MADRGKGSRRAKKKGFMQKLWGFSKLVFLLALLLLAAAGIWYTQQDEEGQRRAQNQAIDTLTWLVELDETNKEADEVLNWLINNVPASRGIVILVADIEGADQYTFAGIPISSRPLITLKNEGYIVGYDESMKNPAWVAYHLKNRVGAKTADRPSRFYVDSRTRAQVDHNDYTNTGYDRGHMAPNYAIGMSYGKNAQMETFFMSNIVPQLPNLNRVAWKEFEQLIANEYLENNEELWIITGPIYSEPIEYLSSGVAVPIAFFKIVVDQVDGGARSLALVMKQSKNDYESLDDYLVSVDSVELFTGLDFFSIMDDISEEAMESAKASNIW